MAEVAAGHVYGTKSLNIRSSSFFDGLHVKEAVKTNGKTVPAVYSSPTTMKALQFPECKNSVAEVSSSKAHAANHVTFQHTYKVLYLGYAVLDRRYTLPMLPWVIAEIKRHGSQNFEEIYIEVTERSLKAVSCESNTLVFEHKLQTISKFAQSSHDPSCFTYMTREVENGPCAYHVFQASNENTVLELFTTSREVTKEMSSQKTAVPPILKTASGVTLDSILNNCRQYEVLYLGRIKVSSKRAPPTFIDDAVEKFRIYEIEKTRNPNFSSSSRQRHGSGVSVSSLPYGLDKSKKPGENELTNKCYGNGENLSYKNGVSSCECSNSKSMDVFSHVSCDNHADPFLQSPLSPLCSETLSKSPSLDQSLGTNSQLLNVPDEFSFSKSSKSSDSKCNLMPPSSLIFHTQSLDAPGCADIVRDLHEIEPGVVLRDRVRSCSGDIPRTKQTSLPLFRDRAGSNGASEFKRPRAHTNPVPSNNRQRNRIMLFLIGNMEICLIGLDKKQMLFTKTFNDIAHCSQGIRHLDHFGFICREVTLSGADCYAGYIFRCETEKVVDEMMQSLKQAFGKAHQSYQSLACKNPQVPKVVVCDACPMYWFHKLCSETEGLTPVETHLAILRKVGSLPDRDKEEIMVKFQNEDFNDEQEQNEVLMMILREFSEHKQMKHEHILSSNPNAKSESVFVRDKSSRLDSFRQKAKKSLSSSLSSFETFLKFSKDEKETNVSEEKLIDPFHRESSLHKESVSDDTSPVEVRPRSSTFSSCRELHITPKRDCDKPDTILSSRSIMNIFIKATTQEEFNSSDIPGTPKSSWRKAIFHKVQTPKKSNDKTNAIAKDEKLTSKRSTEELRALWRKVIMEQILLIRMEKENRKLQVSQDAASQKRIKLNYEEVAPCKQESLSLKWDEVLKDCMNVKVERSKLEELVKEGVPRHKRGEIWLFLAKQHKMWEKSNIEDDSTDSYECLLKKLTSHGHAILSDIGRTFPTHPFFRQTLGSGQLSLFNILKAYSLLDEEVGYCQGLSFIAGIFLLHMDEEQSFSMLKFIMFDLGIRRQYKDDMIAFQVQMYQLSRLIHDNHRELYGHFEKFDISPTLYAAPWFLTLFTSQFPVGFVARLFDLLILNGLEVIFKVSLAVLANFEHDILACDNFESTMIFLKSAVPDMEVSKMKHIFNQALHLDISRELHAYEVEYHVLQDEFDSPSKSNEELERMIRSNKQLKSRNMELTEQLMVAYTTIDKLKASEKSLKSTIKRLEERLVSLEDEKEALKTSLRIMNKRARFDQTIVEEEHPPPFGVVYALAGSEKEEDEKFKELIRIFNQEKETKIEKIGHDKESESECSGVFREPMVIKEADGADFRGELLEVFRQPMVIKEAEDADLSFSAQGDRQSE